jgi:CHAT domain-containing protein
MNYLKLYEQTGKTQFLHNALYTFNYADELLHFMRSSYTSDNTILTNAELYRSLYENALATIYELALKSQNKQYLDLAFLFMEKNSAGLLLENLIAAENKFEIGVSDSLIRAERILRAEADRIQSEIHNRSSTDNDIVRHREELYSLNQKLDNLEGEIANRFPAYYNIKYQNQEFASLSDIQENLGKGDLYMSYYVGKNYIFLLGVHTENGVKLIKIKYDQKLKEAFSRILAVYSDQSNNHYHFKSYERFVKDSYYLYSQLLEPVITDQNVGGMVDNLIIVTNGELGLLPFESLLTNDKMSSSTVDYRNLSYLIRSYRIQYTYSGTLFGRQSRGKLKQNRAKVLAFGYSDDDGTTKEVKDELKGSVYELRALQNMLVGDFLQGSQATETAFKAKAQSSDILHLALHGEANRKNPLGSALYFRSQSDTANDGRLYPYELYPLNLNSRLVVLSSCETGIGKSYSGEGIYSIGRSFSYAGCPSIVMTLWKLNDRITAGIMKDFYKGLTKGQELDESLRRSKLNYLQEADELTAHPVNWAAFVAIGDMSPIRPMERKNSFYLMIAIALTVPTVILALKMLLFSKK